MNRFAFLSLPAGHLARAAPLVAGLALAAVVVSAGQASAAPAALPTNCTQSGTTVTCMYTENGWREPEFRGPVRSELGHSATAVGAPGGSAYVFSNPGGLNGDGQLRREHGGETLYLEVDVLGGPGGQDPGGFTRTAVPGAGSPTFAPGRGGLPGDIRSSIGNHAGLPAGRRRRGRRRRPSGRWARRECGHHRRGRQRPARGRQWRVLLQRRRGDRGHPLGAGDWRGRM